MKKVKFSVGCKDRFIAPMCVSSSSSPYSLKRPSSRYASNVYDAIFCSPIKSPMCRVKTKKMAIKQRRVKVIDAPGVIDNFYFNCIDWNEEKTLGVGLDTSLCVSAPNHQSISDIVSNTSMISCVKWVNERVIAFSDVDGRLFLWDCHENKELERLSFNDGRIGTMSLIGDSLLVGAQNGRIILIDLRTCQQEISYHFHTAEVCGLIWSSEKGEFVSGGNDNSVFVCSTFQPANPVFTFQEHDAAVKAIDVCKWDKHIVATGGGTKDKTIKIWDKDDGKVFNEKYTGSQVTSIHFHTKTRNIISTHSIPGNQISFWDLSGNEIGCFTGHSGRIITSILSPNQGHIASLSADETIRIWEIYDGNSKEVSLLR